MNYLKLVKSKSLLLCGTILGVVMLPAVSANAQCVAKHYLKRHGSSEWQAAGLNPYTNRYVFSVYFSPLQNQLYGNAVPGCAACDSTLNPEVYLGEVSASDMSFDAIVGEEFAPMDEIPIESIPVIEDTGGESIASPSDIMIAPAKPDEPTPADLNDQEPSVELDEAKAEIDRLKLQLESANTKSRAAVDRAYAAEKAAAAAAEIANSKKKQASLESANSERRAGRANKRVEQLEKDAKAAAEKNTGKVEPPKRNKGKQGQFNADEQIKKLNESMERQIKKSSEQITRRNQARIETLLGDGKKDSDPEIIEARKKLKTELEANEAKIRKRINERIQRIRKEAKARSQS